MWGKTASCFKQLEITASYSYRFFHLYNSCIFNVTSLVNTDIAQAKTLDACNSNETRNAEQVFMTFSYCLLLWYFSQTSQHKQQAAWSIWKSTKYVLHLWNLATTSIHKKLQAPWECLHKSRRRQALTKERKQLEACNAVMNNPYQTAPHNHTFPGPPDKKQQVASHYFYNSGIFNTTSLVNTDNIQAKKARCL